MTPCPRCNRHVRGERCPFCSAECVQVTRIRIGRAARATLLALGAIVSVDAGCGGAAYGGHCATRRMRRTADEGRRRRNDLHVPRRPSPDADQGRAAKRRAHRCRRGRRRRRGLIRSPGRPRIARVSRSVRSASAKKSRRCERASELGCLTLVVKHDEYSLIMLGRQQSFRFRKHGGRAARSRPQAHEAGQVVRAASSTAASPSCSSRARDVQDARRFADAASSGCVRGGSRGHSQSEPLTDGGRCVSRRGIFDPKRSRALHRRGARQGHALEWAPRTGDPACTCRQPRAVGTAASRARLRLGRSLSRA